MCQGYRICLLWLTEYQTILPYQHPDYLIIITSNITLFCQMKILTLKENNEPSKFEVFLNDIPEELASAICRKLHAYTVANDIYMSNSLKILRPKIWGYKGTIYKLRVDCGKESARVMFAKTPHNDIVVLHGFIKKTQKTPRKDAMIAMEHYERAKNKAKVTQLLLAKYSLHDRN